LIATPISRNGTPRTLRTPWYEVVARAAVLASKHIRME
jgi:hypothetical protein